MFNSCPARRASCRHHYLRFSEQCSGWSSIGNNQSVLTLPASVAQQLVAGHLRALPPQVRAVLRTFWLEKMHERGLIPTMRQRILAFASAGAIASAQHVEAQYGQGTRD